MSARATGVALVCAAASLACIGPYQNVRVTSHPERSTVFLDGVEIGTTPLTRRIDRTQDHAIYVKRDGYRPQLVVLELQRREDGIHFFLPPDVDVTLSRPRGETERDLEIEIDRGAPPTR